MIALVLIGLGLVAWALFWGAPLFVGLIGVLVIGAGVALRDG